MDAAAPGGLGGTYAGNALAIAAAHAVLDVINDEGLEDRAVSLGARLKERLSPLRSRVPFIAEVRGPGSMVAAEFLQPSSGEPAPAFASKVQALALERGLILLTCGTYGNALRFLYPLTTPDTVFDEALGILESALLTAYAAEPGR
jgi:4-aminobutyrate aminotransferase-like enzyme